VSKESPLSAAVQVRQRQARDKSACAACASGLFSRESDEKRRHATQTALTINANKVLLKTIKPRDGLDL
jgi:hypothetical protein